jgi:phosphatidylglycerophosphatase A
MNQEANQETKPKTNPKTNQSTEKDSLNQKVIKFFATGFGSGLIGPAPGTCGTLVAVPLVYIMMKFLNPVTYLIATVAMVFVATAISELYELQVKTHDLGEVVIDEIVGFMVSMAWMPLSWKAFVAGFILFRFFDIIKPYPISYIDRKVRGGLGVVLDDVAAGLATNICLQMALNYFPSALS